MPKAKQVRPELVKRLWFGEPPIGFLVWWSLGRDLRVDVTHLREMMVSMDLDQSYMPPDKKGGVYVVSEIRKMITRALLGYLGAVSLRAWNGGLYFVAAPYLKELQAFKAILSTMESAMFIAPIHEAGDLAFAVQDAVDAEMDDLAEHVARCRERNARIDSWRNRHAVAHNLVQRCVLYEQVLQIDSSYVTKASSLQKLITGEIDARRDAKTD